MYLVNLFVKLVLATVQKTVISRAGNNGVCPHTKTTLTNENEDLVMGVAKQHGDRDSLKPKQSDSFDENLNSFGIFRVSYFKRFQRNYYRITIVSVIALFSPNFLAKNVVIWYNIQS